MSPAARRRKYRVFLHEWDVWDVILDAMSEVEAIKEAEALYKAHGTSEFSHHDCGDDGFTAEEIEREAGA